MINKQNLMLDFSHIYSEEINTEMDDLKRIDLSDISGTNMYCTKEAQSVISDRLKQYGPEGIHFLDNGNYHYMTKLFAAKINYPFMLVLFDNHTDMQQPMISDLTSCGSWACEALRENEYLKQALLIGPQQKSIDEIQPDLQDKLLCVSAEQVEAEGAFEEFAKTDTKLPAYISIDKDVLGRESARTNWNQGNMTIDTLTKMLKHIFTHQKVIGVDICGECDSFEPLTELIEDERVNRTTNSILYHFIKNYYPDNKQDSQGPVSS